MSSKLRQTITVTILGLIITPPAFSQVTVTQDFFTTSDHIKLSYMEAGQGEALLFIPGWLMPAEIWEPQFRTLSKDYHVIALDPRSQGLSDMTTHGNDPLRRSQDIQELMDHLNLENITLVGWALGAFDALAYLRQFEAAHLNGLVLVDSPLGPPSTPVTQRGKFLQLFQKDRKNANQNYVWGLFKKHPPAPVMRNLIKSAARIPTNIALATLDNTQPGDPWQPKLRILKSLPILYAITPKYSQQASWLREIAPQTKVETFENTGHALFVDDADHFNAALRDFLQQAPRLKEEITNAKHKIKKNPAIKVSREKPQPDHSLPLSSTAPLATFTLTPEPHSFFSFGPKNTPTPFSQAPIPANTPNPPIPSPSPLTILPSPAIPSPTSTFSPIPPALTATVTPLPYVQTTIAAPPTEPPTYLKPHPEKQFLLSAAPIQDGYFTTSDHVKLHYLEGGQGLPIVFIPGWLLPADIWKFQLEDLSSDYHVIALDPRSQGLSDITAKGCDPLRQSRDIQELLDHLNLRGVVLVGWSHGGFQVLAYMGQFGPDRLFAAVLVDSALGAASSPAGSGSRTKFLQNFKKDQAGATKSFVWGLFKKHNAPDFYRKLSDAASKTPNAIAMALMNNYFPGEAYQPSVPTMRQISLLYAVTPKYSNQAQYLLSVYPQATVEYFKGTGHALFVDDAEHFNETLRNFLIHSATYPAGLPKNPPKPGTTPSYR